MTNVRHKTITPTSPDFVMVPLKKRVNSTSVSASGIAKNICARTAHRSCKSKIPKTFEKVNRKIGTPITTNTKVSESPNFSDIMYRQPITDSAKNAYRPMKLNTCSDGD